MGALVSGRHFFRVYGLLKKWPETAEVAEWEAGRKYFCRLLSFVLVSWNSSEVEESSRALSFVVVPFQISSTFVYLMQCCVFRNLYRLLKRNVP